MAQELNEPRFLQLAEDRKGKGWYVGTADETTYFGYLHQDGVIRDSTAVEDEYTGYFSTEEEALEALSKYRETKD